MKKIVSILMVVLAMTAISGCSKDENKNESEKEWVDLGLPSGLLWAECDLGANAPEENGNYYAWGETTPKDIYTWRSYRYCTVDEEGNPVTFTKYNVDSEYGPVDNLVTLEESDDAVTVNMGNGARMPTQEEWTELFLNTTHRLDTVNGVYGHRLTGANGKSIFLAAGGYCSDSMEYRHVGEYGLYWSSSLSEEGVNSARFAYLTPKAQHYVSRLSRFVGFKIRAVRQTL